MAFDIMTERFEVTSILQRELVGDPAVFGRLESDSASDPAVYMESVHHLMKTVAGAPNVRPAWFFDVCEQGEGLSDIGTHLVDLTFWTLFPNQAIDAARDRELLSARRWPTRVPLSDFQRVTGEKTWPVSLTPHLRDDVLDCFMNTAVTYDVRGCSVQLGVIWDWEAPPGGGDTHFAYYRGSQARIEVRQGRAEGYRTELYVVPNEPAVFPRVASALKRRVEALSADYPGLSVSEAGGELHVGIPDRAHRRGHSSVLFPSRAAGIAARLGETQHAGEVLGDDARHRAESKGPAARARTQGVKGGVSKHARFTDVGTPDGGRCEPASRADRRGRRENAHPLKSASGLIELTRGIALCRRDAGSHNQTVRAGALRRKRRLGGVLPSPTSGRKQDEMNRHPRRVERRSFLRAMGVGAAVLPLLEAERAMGQTVAPEPKRVMTLVWPDGMLNGEEAWPGPGTDYVLPDFMQSLEPHRDDIILIRGLAYRFIRDSPSISERTGHAAYPGMLTGAIYQSGGNSTANDVAGGVSLDQYVGSSLREQGYDGLVSLNLGVKVDSTARLSWRGAGGNNAIVPNEDPYDVFNDLFGGQAAGAGPDPAITRVNAMRASILDYVVGDLERFSASLGAADRERIDAHLTSVRELELKLQVTSRGTGGGIPELPQGVNVGSTVNFHTTTEMQMRIVAASFAADVARTAVLQLGDQGGSNIVLTTLGFDASNNQRSGNTGLVQGLHVIAHDDGADKRRTDGFFQEQIAKMIQLLKDTPDGVGRLLDSTALLAMSNMRTGNHQTDNLPAVLAGGMGGYFATGRSLALDRNTPHNGVLIALANAVGVPTETFGNPDYGGELSELRG